MNLDTLLAISPIDGRYANKCAELQEVFSEYGLIKRRVLVECTWLEALCDDARIAECKALSAKERAVLRKIAADFSLDDARRVKEIEKTTNHDVKAVEYFLKEQVAKSSLKSRTEFIHFGCTSEDINNMSHALMLRDGQRILRAAQDEMTATIAQMAKAAAKVPMLAHTHGQPASPTTVGKELAVVSVQVGEAAAPVTSAGLAGAVAGSASVEPKDVPQPVIKSIRVADGFVYVTVANTVPYLQYNLTAGANPENLNESRAAQTPVNGKAGEEIILVTPVKAGGAFFRVNRN